MDVMKVNEHEYSVIKLLGKGKGGYSYLVTDGAKKYTLKQIHHETCSYYTFGNKMESELRDYLKLKNIGIRLPILLDYDMKEERILKEYIDGKTIMDMVKNDEDVSEYIKQVEAMCSLLYKADTNIDYFPTNFIPMNGILYYIDYECNHYMDEWNFENWGIKYWSKTKEFMEYVKNN